jgi:phenylacetate-coenzyme A ligase PaaK-like adenylate-forming protein
VIRSPAVESLPRESMRAIQLGRLRAAVAWAGERVASCSSTLSEAGVKPSTLKSLAGLERLPFTFLREVVDPGTGGPLPILRYRSGDLTHLDLEPCGCGRTTVRVVERI